MSLVYLRHHGDGKRERILQAMVEVVGERSFLGTSVALVAARARVSTGTFYEQFDGLEDCFTAVMDLGLTRAGEMIAQASERERSWCNGIRSALVSLLAFFDSEPLLTRIWFVEVLAAGTWALERREHNVAVLRETVVRRWSVPGYGPPEPHAVVGVMSSALGLIENHLITKNPAPLIVLLGPLMGLITAQYLNTRGVAREIKRGEALARGLLVDGYPPAPVALAAAAEIPETLRAPGAHRARSCVLYIAAHPGVSNRQIGVGVGIAHDGQVSRLLVRLRSLGLLAKQAGAPGHPNAWRLTSEGQRISQLLEQQQAVGNPM
jgi:AcrR family transcriptional regulator